MRSFHRLWLFGMLLVGCAVGASSQGYRTFATPQDLVNAMIAQETAAGDRHEKYEYLSQERSERTGGHLWTERVVATGWGRVRMLLAEDGVPLSADRLAKERDRLAGIVANPDAYIKEQEAEKNDEAHARSMLEELPKGFLLDNVRLEDWVWHVDFKPNPDYSPSGVEERVLHGMSGWMLIDAKDLRLVHIEGRLPSDVSIGFGLLATIHAGSNFMSDRKLLDGHWRTVRVISDIRGKIAMFKALSKNNDVTRSEFQYLDGTLSPAQAVALLER